MKRKSVADIAAGGLNVLPSEAAKGSSPIAKFIVDETLFHFDTLVGVQ